MDETENGLPVDPREDARRLRAEGYSIREISAALGIPKTTVGRWASGDQVSLRHLIRFPQTTRRLS